MIVSLIQLQRANFFLCEKQKRKAFPFANLDFPWRRTSVHPKVENTPITVKNLCGTFLDPIEYSNQGLCKIETCPVGLNNLAMVALRRTDHYNVLFTRVLKCPR